MKKLQQKEQEKNLLLLKIGGNIFLGLIIAYCLFTDVVKIISFTLAVLLLTVINLGTILRLLQRIKAIKMVINE